MRFSVWLSSGRTWPEIRDAARRADATGWDGIWVPDHFMPPPAGYGSEDPSLADPELSPVHEAWSLMAGIAAVTSRARVGVLVSGNTYRHPAVVAKMAATIDHISNGRAVLGLGAAWQENEHRRYGIRYGTPSERSDWLEEAAAVVTGLLNDQRTDFSGPRYRLEGAPLEPKPIQRPLPLMIGGGGERRTLLTAARHAHEWNAWATPAILAAKSAVLDEHCRALERDPGTIDRSAAAFLQFADSPAEARRLRDERGDRSGLIGTPDEIASALESYAAAGAAELVIADFNYQPAARDEALDRFRTEILGR